MSKKTITLTIDTLTIDERLSKRVEEVAERNDLSAPQLVEKILMHLDRTPETSLFNTRLPDDYEPSEWAREWRGGVATPNSSETDHSDASIIADEILRKHSHTKVKSKYPVL